MLKKKSHKISADPIRPKTMAESLGVLAIGVLSVTLFLNQVLANGDNNPVISGYKFYDTDGSGGAKVDNDPGIPNWHITLIDNEGDTALYETDEAGYYKFTLSSAGTYTVCESAYPNWTQVYPAESTVGAVSCDENEGYEPWGWGVTIENGEIVGDLESFDFGNTTKLGDITVRKFNDLNSNGVKDEGEPGIEGIEFRLDDLRLADDLLRQLYSRFLPEDFNRFTITGIDGIAEWTRRLPAGSYEIEEQNCGENEWISTTGCSRRVQLNPTENENKEVLFGNRRPALVVYKSDNNTERLIPNWDICLYKATGPVLDGNGDPVLNDEGEEIFTLGEKIKCEKTIDDEDGAGRFHGAAMFSSDGLELGPYIVDEEERPGWKLESVDGNFENVISKELGQILVRFDESSFDDEDVELYLYNSFTGITGYKWNDLNGDGIRNWEDDNDNEEKNENEAYTEPGLAGWTIVLSDEDGDTREDITDEDGNYSFFDLDDSDYTVCEVKKSGNWTQTYPNNNTDNGDNYYIYDECHEDNEKYAQYGYEASVEEGANLRNLNFGNREIAHIIVRKVTYPESEQEFDFNIDPYEEFSLSNGGEWTFDVVPGTYTVNETVPEDWRLAHVACEYDGDSVGESAPPSGKTVTLDAGDTVICTFTNIGEDITIITGYKWEDLNGDGIRNWDENNEEYTEPGRKDWNMALGRVMPREEGTLTPAIPIEIVALSLTGTDGWYFLPVTEQGDYKVFEEKRAGWSTTNPSAVDSFFDIEYRIDLNSEPPLVPDSFFDVFVELEGLIAEPGQTIMEDARGNPLDFGNFNLADITGIKWNDENGNGRQDRGESGLSDIIVALGHQNGEPVQRNGHEIIPIEIIAMSLTGADGGFTVPNVGPGRYKLFEEAKSGWQATNPPQRIDSFFDIAYDLDLIAKGDPDFDLLRIGDPDFDLLRSSFFDVFVEISGQDFNNDENQLNFGNRANKEEAENGDDEENNGEETNPQSEHIPACADNADSDGDGDIDLDDRGCANSEDDDETNPGGGEGGGNGPVFIESGPGQVLGAAVTSVSIEDQIAVLRSQITVLQERLERILNQYIRELLERILELLQQRLSALLAQ